MPGAALIALFLALCALSLAAPPSAVSSTFAVKRYLAPSPSVSLRVVDIESAVVVTRFDQPLFIRSPCALQGNGPYTRTESLPVCAFLTSPDKCLLAPLPIDTMNNFDCLNQDFTALELVPCNTTAAASCLDETFLSATVSSSSGVLEEKLYTFVVRSITLLLLMLSFHRSLLGEQLGYVH